MTTTTGNKNYDVIIIGAGHNGLVCASVLSRNGKKVLVLEANEQIGGLTCSREFAPGFKVSSAAHLLYGLHPRVVEQCELEHFGLKNSVDNMTTIVTNSNKEYLKFASGPSANIQTNACLEQAEDKRWAEFHIQMKKFSSILYGLTDKQPPRLKHTSVRDYKTLFKVGIEMRRLGKQDIRQFLRIIGMNIYDLVDENLTSDLLKAAVCFEAILGTRLGPRAPNTVYNWLNRRSIMDQNESGLSLPTGGMGTVCKALNDSAVNRGAQIETNSRVRKVLVENNQVSGVELETGKIFTADKIVSNADIKHTMLSLVGSENLDTDVVRRALHIPMQGSTAKIHIGLNKLPGSITGNQSDFSSRIIFASDPDAIEFASNSIKYAEYTTQPVFEITFPSINDSSLAAQGKHVMSVLIPYVPYKHKNGWTGEKKYFENHMLDHIDRVLPGTKKALVNIQTLTPVDIEQQFNVTGGHWHHGDIGLERFLMLRPMSGYAQYTTSIYGLFLCGADCHPGGDVTGAAGLNAANAVLKRRS